MEKRKILSTLLDVLNNPHDLRISALFLALNKNVYFAAGDGHAFILNENNMWSLTSLKESAMMKIIKSSFDTHIEEHKQLILESCESAELRWIMRDKTIPNFFKKIENRSSCDGVIACIPMFSNGARDTDGASRLTRFPYLLPFKNGVYDLNTGEFTPGFRAEQYVEYTTGYDFPGNTDEDWDDESQATLDSFLKEILVEDGHVVFVKKHTALSLANENRLQFMIFFIGEGRNGKGTFVDLIWRVFGQLCHPIPTKSLVNIESSVDGFNSSLFNGESNPFA